MAAARIGDVVRDVQCRLCFAAVAEFGIVFSVGSTTAFCVFYAVRFDVLSGSRASAFIRTTRFPRPPAHAAALALQRALIRTRCSRDGAL